MTGAILSWGTEGATLADLLRLVRRQRIALVVDRPRPRQTGFRRTQLADELKRAGVVYQFTPKLGPTPEPASVGALYAAARAGNRVLILGHPRDPAKDTRGPLLEAIAREARAYAISSLAEIVIPIEIAHLDVPQARGKVGIVSLMRPSALAI